MKHTIIVPIERALQIASLFDKAGLSKSFKVYDHSYFNHNLMTAIEMKPKAYKYYLAIIK